MPPWKRRPPVFWSGCSGRPAGPPGARENPMSRAPSCPTAESFECLRRGELPPAEVERLAAHVAGCDRCVAAVHSLKAEDALLVAVRACASASNRPAKDVVLALAKRLNRSRAPAASPPTLATTPRSGRSGTASAARAPAANPPTMATADTVATGSADGGPAVGGADGADVTGFLAPPQGPGELGRLGSYR